MEFIADFHVHSKYSRATAKNLDLENIYIAAKKKGISVMGTGDFTHPAWFKEIQDKLIPDGSGLFRLKPEIEKDCDAHIPSSCPQKVHFVLSAEISNIYKKNEKTRKNHNVILLPDIKSAENLNLRLDAIGNIKSDGRPILGLDAQKLFEMTLDISNDAMFIPAHIWTPWFSVLGSKSGFDSIQECFEELTPYIAAVETGLSSDPKMNWQVAELDQFTLVSNSDAHSTINIGRNANLFDTDLSYSSIFKALKSKDPQSCLGTLDLYPQEGKYHFDGHRNCDVVLDPADTKNNDNLCPKCGKPLTLGVLYRVHELASRPLGFKPKNALPYTYIICLSDILADIFSVGPKTKTVATQYDRLIEAFGPELDIIRKLPLEKFEKTSVPLLKEAIKRVRNGNIDIAPGFDGEYGKISIFQPEDKEKFGKQRQLFGKFGKKMKVAKKSTTPKKQSNKKKTVKPGEIKQKKIKESTKINSLNEAQQQIVQFPHKPLLIQAGPGTGKTYTLTCRITHLIHNDGVPPENICAITFTNQAAEEMRMRIKKMLNAHLSGTRFAVDQLPEINTFHGFCYFIIRQEIDQLITILDEEEQKQVLERVISGVKVTHSTTKINKNKLLNLISLAKQNLLAATDFKKDSPHKIEQTITTQMDLAEFVLCYELYQEYLSKNKRVDFEDLIFKVVDLFQTNSHLKKHYQNKYPYVFVDEYQDLNFGQYQLVRQLAPENASITVIGDPNQAIYGFRGSDARFFNRFLDDYPQAKKLSLDKSYRSCETILTASHLLIVKSDTVASHNRVYSDLKGDQRIHIMANISEEAEAVAIGKIIEDRVGGMGFYSIDQNKVSNQDQDLSFSDFAVLFRTRAQSSIFLEIFEKAGIPCQFLAKSNWYSQAGIKKVISFIKIIEGMGDQKDVDNILPILEISGNGNQLDQVYGHELIKNLISKTRGLFVKERLAYLLNEQVISQHIQNNAKLKDGLEKLTVLAEPCKDDIIMFLNALALQTDPDLYEKSAEKVTLMSLHGSKGLEFPIVFISGCEEGLIPLINFKGQVDDREEERRLFYVGMTRAKDVLYLSYAHKRRIFGKRQDRKLSSFINDFEEKLSWHQQKIKGKLYKKPKQLTFF